MQSISTLRELLSGFVIAIFGLMIAYVGLLALTGSDDLGSWWPAFALAVPSGAGIAAWGGRVIVRILRGEKGPRHQDAMRVAVGLPPYPPLRPSPLPGRAPAAADAPARVDALVAPVSRRGLGERKMPSGEPILAYWTYPAQEWTAFTAAEWRYRVWEAVILAVLVGGIGGFLMAPDVGVGTAFGYSLMAGAVLVGLRLMMADSQRHANAAAPGEVIIAPTAVLMNGRHHKLASERIRFGGVRYAELDRPPVLEFTIEWKTRHGWTNEQIRVPVPAGREAEARKVVAAFERGWAVELPLEQA